MGYVTVSQLVEKYGSVHRAAMNYLIGGMSDKDESEAVELRFPVHALVMAKLEIIDTKLDLLLKR